MPRLLLLLPCEKMLLEPNANRVSLIGLLDDLRLGLPATTSIPEGAALPLPWAAFALWRREEADEGKEFEQLLEVIGPDGKRLAQGTMTFRLEKSVHRTTVNFTALPISSMGGEYTLQLSLREATEGSEMRPVASFPFGVHTS